MQLKVNESEMLKPESENMLIGLRCGILINLNLLFCAVWFNKTFTSTSITITGLLYVVVMVRSQKTNVSLCLNALNVYDQQHNHLKNLDFNLLFFFKLKDPCWKLRSVFCQNISLLQTAWISRKSYVYHWNKISCHLGNTISQ